MSKADKLFIKMCTDIIENGCSSEGQEVRPRWEDGTPAHTIKTFGVVNRYNLQEEFPALTLRPTYIKSAMDELLWIWQKKSNITEELNSNIWNAWGTLQLDNRNITYVNIPDVSSLIPFERKLINEIIPHKIEDEKNSKKCGKYFKIKDLGNRKCLIQFLDTGNIKEISTDLYRTGGIFDNYSISVYGIGYYGNCRKDEYKEYFGNNLERWIDIWRHICRRCSPNNKNLAYKDVKISSNFRSCEYFLGWVKDNNYYGQEFLDILCVDKDYYGANCYSEISCVILTQKENTLLTLNKWYHYDDQYFFSREDLVKYIDDKLNTSFVIYNKNNERVGISSKFRKTLKEMVDNGIIKEINIKEKYNNKLVRFNLKRVHSIGTAYGFQIGKKYIHHVTTKLSDKKFEELKNLYPSFFTKEIIDEDTGELKIYVYLDQIDGVLYDLRNNPFSRRIMTNIYNFEDLHAMNLYPCAYSMTFNVTEKDGKKILNGILNQRSQDILAANNWNVVQYSILLMMIAQSVDMIPGELIHVISDAHIYDRHVDIIKEMIKRPQYPAPTVRLNPEIKNFYDFTLDDIIIENYEKNPQIKNIPIAV